MISTNMITATEYRCSLDLIEQSSKLLNESELPITLNEPLGDFFTDPWQLKSQFRGSLWAQVLSTLDQKVGQARIIKLDPATCYHCHADIDDRFHLNLQGEMCYLIDLDDRSMYEIKNDGVWYSMDASKIHSAVNFGRYVRYQLVVRKLLPKNILHDPVKIQITSSGLSLDDARFIFDNTISPWLNTSYKTEMISDFKNKDHYVELSIEKHYLDSLKDITSQNIKVEIYD